MALGRLAMRHARHSDAPRIAEIHMAAFGPNAMLHAQFPTPAIRKGLQTSIELKAIADIQDSKTTVLLAVIESDDPEKNHDTVVAFAKWTHPVHPGENYVEPAWDWPEGTDLATLDAWIAKATETEKRSVGDTPCFCLLFIGTDPKYGRRGAGHMLVQWGIEQSKSTGSPVYLESTVESADFYKKRGFSQGETISLPIRVDGRPETQIYEEIAFTYWPA